MLDTYHVIPIFIITTFWIFHVLLYLSQQVLFFEDKIFCWCWC
jgi:hypothetical protein